MKSIEVKGTARTIAERSSEQARALKATEEVKTFISLYLLMVCVTWFILRTST